jgi:hypothetical protein
MAHIGPHAARLQRAEETVRREVGLWLREHTPPEARIAMEPIGYIGYYSRRRILDEVGLVSPEMVPLNREGAGWFDRMVRQLRPDYIVERPGYLVHNRTLNSKVPMFRAAADREAFLAAYQAVAVFHTGDVPERLLHDYRFVVYARRSPGQQREWRRRWSRLSPSQRSDLTLRALLGPDQAGERVTR